MPTVKVAKMPAARAAIELAQVESQLEAFKPLNEMVWRKWIEKNRVQDAISAARHMKALKWVSLTALLIIAIPWMHVSFFDVVLRFIVTAGALTLLFQELKSNQHALAILFGAVVLFENPIVPFAASSGNWLLALTVASAVPFIVSLGQPVAAFHLSLNE